MRASISSLRDQILSEIFFIRTGSDELLCIIKNIVAISGKKIKAAEFSVIFATRKSTGGFMTPGISIDEDQIFIKIRRSIY